MTELEMVREVGRPFPERLRRLAGRLLDATRDHDWDVVGGVALVLLTYADESTEPTTETGEMI